MIFNRLKRLNSFVEENKRQRMDKTLEYRQKWDLLSMSGLKYNLLQTSLSDNLS